MASVASRGFTFRSTKSPSCLRRNRFSVRVSGLAGPVIHLVKVIVGLVDSGVELSSSAEV
jgi:hypothetical protein